MHARGGPILVSGAATTSQEEKEAVISCIKKDTSENRV
jgi:hypothetical protein